MTFTNAWNETTPAGTAKIKDGDNRIRELKVDVRERLNVEHHGYANEAGADPGATAPTGSIGKHREGSARVFVGTAAAKPAFGDEGRVYYETDTLKTWVDTGAAWLQIASWAVIDRAQVNVYSTGTVTTIAGSATVAGSGTDWTTANGVVAGAIIGIVESDGITRWYNIASVGGVTALTLSFPVVTTGATLSYTISTNLGGAMAYRCATGNNFTGAQTFYPNYGGVSILLKGSILADAGKTIDGVDISAHNHTGGSMGVALVSGLSAYVAKSIDTAYEAATDGFVVAYATITWAYNVDTFITIATADTEGGSYTTLAKAGAKCMRGDSALNITYAQATLPVQKTKWYKVSKTASGVSATFIYWIPSGA